MIFSTFCFNPSPPPSFPPFFQRVAPRLADLTPAELADVFALAVRVGGVIERQHAAASLTVAVQDGPDAGQTVPHAHVHVLPRAAGDFERNDDVYPALEAAEAGLGPGLSEQSKRVATTVAAPDPVSAAGDDRQPRTAADMAAEAASLRALF